MWTNTMEGWLCGQISKPVTDTELQIVHHKWLALHQRLPCKLTAFQHHTINLCQLHDYLLGKIGETAETPVLSFYLTNITTDTNIITKGRWPNSWMKTVWNTSCSSIEERRMLVSDAFKDHTTGSENSDFSSKRKPNDTLGSMTSNLQVLDVAVKKPAQNNYTVCSGEQLLSGNCLLTPVRNRWWLYEALLGQ